MGIHCTHALVFAQLIVKDKNYGVHVFLVPLRDKDLNPLPGIKIGDIGPKIGFHSKDNGYLQMDKVIIPKSNMLRKYVSVNKKGLIKTKGDPKVSYATMMSVRKHMSSTYLRIYAASILIACRYSVFRKQFSNS